MNIFLPIWLLATLGGLASVWGTLMVTTWIRGSAHPAWPELTFFQKLSISSASVIPFLRARWYFMSKNTQVSRKMKQRTMEINTRLAGEILEVDSLESLRSLLNSPVSNGKTIRLTPGGYSAASPIHISCKDTMVDLTDCQITFPTFPLVTIQGENNIIYNGVFLFPKDQEVEGMVPMASDSSTDANKALFLAVNGGGDRTSMINLSVNPEGDAA